MYYYLIPLLRKRSDKIILHVGTKDALHIKADEMLEESAPTIRLDKHNANESINFIKLLETNYFLLNKHPNIKENHLDRYGLHLNHDSTRVLAKNLRLCAQKY